MSAKADNCLLAIAKKIIEVAAFFGISRKLVIYFHCLISALLIIPSVSDHEATCFGILIGCFLGHAWFLRAMECYREDDRIENKLELRYRWARLITLLLYGGLSFHLFFPPGPHTSLFLPMIIAKIFIPAYFWPWLILNQNTGSRGTAKDIIKGLIAGLKKIARESLRPQPVPQPVPVRSFTELPPPPAGALLVYSNNPFLCRDR